jgi:hypothetical protein
MPMHSVVGGCIYHESCFVLWERGQPKWQNSKALDIAGLEVKDLDSVILHNSAIRALQSKRNWRSLLVKRKKFELRLTLLKLP